MAGRDSCTPDLDLLVSLKFRKGYDAGIRTISADALNPQGIEKSEVCDLNHKPANQASDRGDIDEPSKHHRRIASETQVDKRHEDERCSHGHVRRSESVGA